MELYGVRWYSAGDWVDGELCMSERLYGIGVSFSRVYLTTVHTVWRHVGICFHENENKVVMMTMILHC